MAWRGKVAAKRTDQATGMFALAVDFYDDATPANVIVRRDIVVPATATPAEVQILVRAEGVRERAKYSALAALDGRIDVGDEVTV